MKETDLNKMIQQLLIKLWPGEQLFWHRVENVAAIGTFDVFFGTPWGSGWVELKIAGPKAKPDVRPGQPGFAMRCLAAGVPAHILCCSDKGYVKLLEGICLGSDWEDHLVGTAEFGNAEAMRSLLMACTTAPARPEGSCGAMMAQL